ncbi:MAG: hypothetical protein ABIF88_00625 [archaeon]
MIGEYLKRIEGIDTSFVQNYLIYGPGSTFVVPAYLILFNVIAYLKRAVNKPEAVQTPEERFSESTLKDLTEE